MTQPSAAETAVRAARARKIRIYRASEGINQVAFAKRVNEALAGINGSTVSRGHLAKLETGAKPLTGALLRAVAAVLGITPEELADPLGHAQADAA